MKKLILCVIGLIALAIPFAPTANAEEIINSFDSVITVNQDSSMIVKETIAVHSDGINIRHGIYRDFPIRYRDAHGDSITVGFKVLSVKRNNFSEYYSTESANNGTRIYIGNKNYLLPAGNYTYELTYKTTRQLGYFPDHDELYWNVTGNGWIFPIKQATAEVILPSGIATSSLEMAAYTGAQGSQGADYSAGLRNGHAYFETTAALDPKSGLTIVVGWPKGYVAMPTPTDKALAIILSNLGIILGLAGLLIIFAYFFIVWLKFGRDPEKSSIIPEYEPPVGMSPAKIAYLWYYGQDSKKALTSSIINMAIKKYIKIERLKGILFLPGNYKLTRISDDQSALESEEKIIAGAIFLKLKKKSGKSVGLENVDEIEVKKENSESFLAALNAMQSSLEKTKNFSWHAGWTVFGVIASISTIYAMIALQRNYDSFSVYILMSLIIALLIIMDFVFAYLLRALTPEGRKLRNQIEGFKLFLSVTEKDRMNFHNPPEKTPELFEKYLPYALALGVENMWAKQFNDVFAQLAEAGTPYVPVWYAGTDFNAGSMGVLTHDLGASFSGAISSAAVVPGSSSGFGGGFSGGGGGGGGGGGW